MIDPFHIESASEDSQSNDSLSEYPVNDAATSGVLPEASLRALKSPSLFLPIPTVRLICTSVKFDSAYELAF